MPLALDGVKVELGNRIVRMGSDHVICNQRTEKMEHDPRVLFRPVDLSGPYKEEETRYQADAVVCALGMKAVNGLANELINKGYDVELIGDAHALRKIFEAIHEGYHAGRRA